MEFMYLAQLKGNGVETFALFTIKGLYKFANLKPERMEIYYLQHGQEPKRLRWEYDGVTFWLYDRYGNVFDKYAKG